MAFRNRERIEGIERKFTHLPQKRMHRKRNNLHPARRKRTFRLVIISLRISFQKFRTQQKLQTGAYIDRRNRIPTRLRNFKRFRSPHRNSKFAHHRMLPSLVKGIHIAVQDLHIVGLAQFLHFFEAFLFQQFRLGVFVTDHQNKVVVVKATQAHGSSGLLGTFFNESRSSVADKFQVRARCKTGYLGKLAPRKSRSALALAIVFQYILAIVSILDYRFHFYAKIPFFLAFFKLLHKTKISIFSNF